MVGNGIFEISDGTDTVRFIGAESGFQLSEYSANVANYRDGGLFTFSPFSEGKYPVRADFDDVVDLLTFQVNGACMDQAIEDAAKLKRLLVKAVDYWTNDNQTEPVWIARRGILETNTSYAILKGWAYPHDDDPFTQPFFGVSGAAVMEDVEMSLVHGHWLEKPPGQGTNLASGYQTTYNGQTYGRSAYAAAQNYAGQVYLSNKNNMANLTHVFRYDASGPAWSGNFIGAAVPFKLFPDPAGVGDILYYGIDTTVANSGPFCNVVHDLQQGDQVGVFEYYNGAWVALTVQDDTDDIFLGPGRPYGLDGVNGIFWQQPADWIPVAVNGVTGYWMRFRITNPGAPVPQQLNRNIYTVTWNHTEVAGGVLGGDIPALAKIFLRQTSNLTLQRLLLWTRSESRNGNDTYRGSINFSDEQNPGGITVVDRAAFSSNFSNDATAPTGRVIIYNPAGVEAFQWRAQISLLAGAASQDYMGVFHLYGRVKQVGGAAGDFTMRLDIYQSPNTGVPVFVSEEIQTKIAGAVELVDFGTVQIPPEREVYTTGIHLPGEISIFLYVSNSNAAPGDLYMIDLIPMAVDEFSMDVLDPYYLEGSALTDIEHWQGLEVDAIRIPKRSTTVLWRDAQYAGSEDIFARWQAVHAKPFWLQASADQRVYAVGADWNSGSSAWVSYISQTFMLRLQRSQRYLGMRGSR